MTLKLPEFAFVVLIGASGSGKSTFARKHFKPTEVVSSDTCRGLVSDDENSLAATGDAFDLVRFIAAKRLKNLKTVVVDATSVRREDRKPLLELAREYHCLSVAIVFDLPESVSHERNRSRPERDFGPHVVRHQAKNLKRGLKGLKREGFRYVYTFKSAEDVDAAELERQPLWTDKRGVPGPFDIIGDVHGCADELERLLEKLGYGHEPVDAHYPRLYTHPDRKAVFLGDLMDRGPRNLDVYGIVKNMVAVGAALCVPGNHDVKLLRKLKGSEVQVTHGLDATLAELEALSQELRPSFERELAAFLDGLVSHYLLDDGRLVVAHAGLREDLQGRASGTVRSFALYGETTGETDEFGLPVRYNWASDYRGQASVVYGHTPVPEAQWLNNTLNIDTGCVFGGRLSALRYPENELVDIPAARVYAEPIKPLAQAALPLETLSAQQEGDDVLDLGDVTGKRVVTTRYGNVTLRAENSAVALETMSRFAVNPKWLVYLPPTMAAPKTTSREGLLEHPDEAFSYYASENISDLVCQEKHMGSRALLVVCRDSDAARRRFGILGETGVCYTRTGRTFFGDKDLEAALLGRVRAALTHTGFWEALDTDWALFDAELMPWSTKAQALLETQYAAVGAAATHGLARAKELLVRAAARGVATGALLAQTEKRVGAVAAYRSAYRHYCWPVSGVDDLRLAPFHLLATEGAVHTDKPHTWHLETQHTYLTSTPSPLLHATAYRQVTLNDASSVAEAVRWWETLTSAGGEGMVVKPLSFTARGKRGLAQPAVKVRGHEYLRIIYGPEYSLPDNLARLRARNVNAKRSLAAREFVLGLEALYRFVDREPLRRVHECVFGVLALESEAVDPRL